MQRQLFGRQEKLAFAAGALIMLGIVGASGWLSVRAARDLNLGAHTLDIRISSVELMRTVTTAEAGQRAYLLKGQPSALAAYTSAAAQVPPLVRLLSGEVAGDPDFPIWRDLIEHRVAELARTMRLARDGHRDDAMRIAQSDPGESSIERTLIINRRMADRQRAALAVGIERSRRRAMSAVGVDAAAFVLLLTLGIGVANGARRFVQELRRVQQEAMQAATDELVASEVRLEAAVRARTAELTNTNERIQRFAYIVSHDLREPLVNIVGFAGELETAAQTLESFIADRIAQGDVAVPKAVRAASQVDLPEAIGFIHASTSKMERLTDAILRMSREGRRVMVPEQLDMAALLANVAASLRHQSSGADAELLVGPAPPIQSDRIAIEQIFSNLMENAIKYRFPGRREKISVQGAADGPMVVYTVRDNGRGIAARDLDRVFEPFRRAGPQDTPGEGIGLANVQALVRRLGGEVECTSLIDVGSEFSVRLPRALADSIVEPS